MRELTSIETCYLGGLLLLSLLLPLLMSFRNPQDPACRKTSLKIVWFGQAILAIAGLILLTSALLAPYAVILSAMTSVGCAYVLIQHGRGAVPIKAKN